LANVKEHRPARSLERVVDMEVSRLSIWILGRKRKRLAKSEADYFTKIIYQSRNRVVNTKMREKVAVLEVGVE
jgi:hypothetical protein